MRQTYQRHMGRATSRRFHYWQSYVSEFHSIPLIDERKIITATVNEKHNAYVIQCASSTTEPASCPCKIRGSTNQIRT